MMRCDDEMFAHSSCTHLFILLFILYCTFDLIAHFTLYFLFLFIFFTYIYIYSLVLCYIFYTVH